jgi:hypothetical protein
MARIEDIVRRLKNWERWMVTMKSGGIGFATQSSFLCEARTDRYRESTIPIMDEEASITNSAVESLRHDQHDLYLTLICIYQRGIGYVRTSRELGCAVSSVHARLERADKAIQIWLLNRDDEKKKKSYST